MPTILSHGGVGLVLAKLGWQDSDKRIILASILAAAVPDLDALFLGAIPYNAPLGHRGLTHSLFFASLLGLAIAFVFKKAGWAKKPPFSKLALLFAIVTASHGFFDAMTDGGLGVAFFAPFNNTRYFLPWRPIPVAPLSAQPLFTPRGMRLMIWESALFGTFAVAVLVWDRRSIWRKVSAGACALVGIAAWIAGLSGSPW